MHWRRIFYVLIYGCLFALDELFHQLRLPEAGRGSDDRSSSALRGEVRAQRPGRPLLLAQPHVDFGQEATYLV